MGEKNKQTTAGGFEMNSWYIHMKYYKTKKKKLCKVIFLNGNQLILKKRLPLNVVNYYDNRQNYILPEPNSFTPGF